ncbi:MAG: anthranilate phosphoribosyltransferase [Deltaproteobacteria bacterium]|nr:anthranilate phosphoribosyltransferase [Deltaproteobacteria bacterium]
MLSKLVQRESVKKEEIKSFLKDYLGERKTEAEMASFLTALRMREETAEEIAAVVEIMDEVAIHLNLDDEIRENAIDTCGTGGDEKGTFNISTACAFIVAGAGVYVAKHGNRAVSSRCGSADLLNALGININLEKEKAEKILKQAGIIFLFAPLFHPAMKKIAQVRKALGFRTLFNIIGPLLNPAGVKRQLIGVPSQAMMDTLSAVIKLLGNRRIMLVNSMDGLDEVSVCADTHIADVNGMFIKKYTISPGDFGIKRYRLGVLKGGEVTENTCIMMDVLNNKDSAYRDAALVNASVALLTADRVKDLKEGYKMAELSLASGKAKQKFELLRKLSND